MIFATGRRRAGSDAPVTGTLSAETRTRDASREGASGEELDANPEDASAEARERARETRQAIGSGGGVATRGGTAVAERLPGDPEEIEISRRQFFNRGILVTMAVSLGAFGAAAIGFLYAKSVGGFGGIQDAGTGFKDIQAFWAAKKEPFYVPEARTYLQPYPKAALPKARKIAQYKL